MTIKAFGIQKQKKHFFMENRNCFLKNKSEF